MSAMGGGKQGITPQQFVQQRAAAVPQYAYARQSSTDGLRSGTPTPPLVRNRSSDRLTTPYTRNSSAELSQRPHSRGPSMVFGPSGNGDYSAKLSAREQEHVARLTGGPLVHVTPKGHQRSPSTGLLGAIETREREKRDMKYGLSSQTVEHAILQRQQETPSPQPYLQYSGQQHGEQYTAPQLTYGNMPQYQQSQYAQSQYQLQPQPQRQSWASPSVAAYGQGGGWVRSSPHQGTPEGVQQHQYFPQQPGQGRGGQGQQGQ